MDNDSVIDPPPPNESRRRNLVLLSQHERAPPFRFHTREPPLISNSLKLSLSLSSLFLFTSSRFNRAKPRPSLPPPHLLLLLTTTAIHQM